MLTLQKLVDVVDQDFGCPTALVTPFSAIYLTNRIIWLTLCMIQGMKSCPTWSLTLVFQHDGSVSNPFSFMKCLKLQVQMWYSGLESLAISWVSFWTSLQWHDTYLSGQFNFPCVPFTSLFFSLSLLLTYTINLHPSN